MKRVQPRRWGRVSAKPSEYLIKLRRGKVVAQGAGLSVRLWPADTCTILPTSIQRTSFVADQITAEKVGVAVTGIAVFRIADPMLAFRMLDFTEGSDGVDQLATILREMFIGAARRLVANMSVDQCLTQRKESIAQELMREIQPVVSGSGRPDDGTDRGWGVVIDTIEIQDVRILSEKVFADLQAPYRCSLELERRKSTVERDLQIHQREVGARREMLEVDQDLRRRQAEAAEQTSLEDLAQQERLQRAQAEMEQRLAASQLEAHLAHQQRSRTMAEAEHETAQREAEQRSLLEQQQAREEAQLAVQRAEQDADLRSMQLQRQLAVAELEAQLALHQTETERVRQELKLRLRRGERELDNLFSDERLRHELITTALPAVAQAFARSLGQVNLTRFVSDGSTGKGGLAETVAQLLEVARGCGVDLGRLLGASPDTDRGAGQA